MKRLTHDSQKTFRLTLLAILTALVVVLQLLGSFIRLGPFSVSLVLLPIVIGVAFSGALAGAWLGFVFSLIVMLSGDANVFWAISPWGTLITVFAKGILCGLGAGAVYQLLHRLNRYLAVVVAAVVCPILNTGIFLLGCRLFFYDAICSMASGNDMSVVAYLFVGLVGANFLFELLFNLVLSPAIVRIIRIKDHSL